MIRKKTSMIIAVAISIIISSSMIGCNIRTADNSQIPAIVSTEKLKELNSGETIKEEVISTSVGNSQTATSTGTNMVKQTSIEETIKPMETVKPTEIINPIETSKPKETIKPAPAPTQAASNPTVVTQPAPSPAPTQAPQHTKPAGPDMPSGWKTDLANQVLALLSITDNKRNYIRMAGEKVSYFDGYFEKLKAGTMSASTITATLINYTWREKDYWLKDEGEVYTYGILNDGSSVCLKYETNKTTAEGILDTIENANANDYYRLALYWHNDTKKYTVYILSLEIMEL